MLDADAIEHHNVKY